MVASFRKAVVVACVVLAACTGGRGSAELRSSSSSSPHDSGVVMGSPSSPPVKPYQPTNRTQSDQLIDLSWFDPTFGWALVGRSCGADHARCALLYRTRDSGQSWTLVSAFPAEVGRIQRGAFDSVGFCEPSHPCVGGLRFVTPRIGYAYGPSMLMTTDGGRSWRNVTSPKVESLTSTGSEVFRLVYRHTGCPGPCDPIIQESNAGGRSWETVPLPKNEWSGFGESIFAARSNLYVFAWGHIAGGTTSHARIAVSHDEGRTWSIRTDPCGYARPHNEEDAAAASAAGDSLGVLCVSKSDGGSTFTALSRDAGRTFTKGRPASIAGAEQIAIDWKGDIAVGNAGTTGNGKFTYTLALSHDGGEMWRSAIQDMRPVAEDLASGYLQFVTSRELFWVGYPYFLWRSLDAGRTWHRSHSP